MPFAIRIMGSRHRELRPDVRVYLKSYDVEANGGLGDADFTEDKAEALRFDTAADALAAYRQQSKTRPVLLDGRTPNRPLTALTVEIADIDAEATAPA